MIKLARSSKILIIEHCSFKRSRSILSKIARLTFSNVRVQRVVNENNHVLDILRALNLKFSTNLRLA